MAKPPSIVEWAGSGTATEPSSGKKAAGWLPGEQPPAEFMNWLFKFAGLWTKYLNELEATEALTWALSQIFNKAITVGNSFAASEAEAISPRIIAEPVSSSVADYTLLLKAKDARLWAEGVGSDSALVLTVNATRTTDGTDKWAKITSSQPAMAFFVSRAGVSIAYMPATQNTAWTSAFVEGEGTTNGWGRALHLQSEGAARTTANHNLPLLSQQFNTGTVARGYIGQFKISTSQDCRLYVTRLDGDSNTSGLEIVLGATWDNSANNWVRDSTSRIIKFTIGANDFYIDWKASGTAGTTFTTWDTKIFDWVFPTTTTAGGTATDHQKLKMSNGVLSWIGTQASDADDTNPPAQTDHTNEVGPRNVEKVTAYLTSGSTPSLLSGYNVDGTTPISTSSSLLTLNFGANLADANYEVSVTIFKNDTSNFYTPQITAKAAGSLTVAVFKTVVATGVHSLVDLGANTDQVGLDIKITGRQNS